MCGACAMNAVKDRMLSQRQVFAAPESHASGPASVSLPNPAGLGSVVDMTHELFEAFPTYDGSQQVFREQVLNWDDHRCNLFDLTINEHVGTHIDAPLHYSADGHSVSEIALDNLVAPLCVIDIRARAATDSDTQVTPDDIRAWIARNGEIPAHACIAMNSGWAAKLHTEAYRNLGDDGVMHFPGFHSETADMLMKETAAMSIAVDTLSLDHGPSKDFATHCAWLPSGRFGIECLANLDKVPDAGATLVIGAPKLRGGTGGQARIFAFV